MRRDRKLEKVNEQGSDNKELKKDDMRMEDTVAGKGNHGRTERGKEVENAKEVVVDKMVLKEKKIESENQTEDGKIQCTRCTREV